MVAGMARRRAGPRAGCALLLLPALARADCSWTHESSGASWDLTALQAADHYQFRGMVGAQDSLHATTITAYEDYTYFLNLCKCGRPARAPAPAALVVPKLRAHAISPVCPQAGDGDQLRQVRRQGRRARRGVPGPPQPLGARVLRARFQRRLDVGPQRRGRPFTGRHADVRRRRDMPQADRAAGGEGGRAAAAAAARVQRRGRRACAGGDRRLHGSPVSGGRRQERLRCRPGVRSTPSSSPRPAGAWRFLRAAGRTAGRCTYVPPAAPEPPSTYTETVVEWASPTPGFR